MNGERYHAWDSVLASIRFYRTHRERLSVWYPAASVGDLGAATGALLLVVAATGIARGYAPGPLVMCEASSDEGLRAACAVVPPARAERPPFHRIDQERLARVYA
jgi:3-oxoacyl-[acyl-carrier-protein] synthase-1